MGVLMALFRKIPEADFKKSEDDGEALSNGGAGDHRKWRAGIIFEYGGRWRYCGGITGAPEQHFVRAFAVSIALIVALSYVLVESTIVFSAGIGIPPVIVALTLLAAGTSAPDLIASVDVARAGRGGMAVANAVGSNTFDLLVGLALPWTIALSVLGLAGVNVGHGRLVDIHRHSGGDHAGYSSSSWRPSAISAAARAGYCCCYTPSSSSTRGRERRRSRPAKAARDDGKRTAIAAARP